MAKYIFTKKKNIIHFLRISSLKNNLSYSQLTKELFTKIFFCPNEENNLKLFYKSRISNNTLHNMEKYIIVK